MTQPMAPIRADFDRIALLPKSKWNHNDHYHRFLVDQLPPHCTNALEIGCGTGAFSRLLADRTDHVLALDLSPQMIRLAQEASTAYANIDFRVADIVTEALPAAHFDCIATIATLHHLPLDEMLTKIKRALRAGGTLIVLDLYKADDLSDTLASAVAFPADVVMRLLRNGRIRQSQAAREAWTAHAPHERYLTLPQIRQTCANILPCAQVRRHLFWRYSIVWTKAVHTGG